MKRVVNGCALIVFAFCAGPVWSASSAADAVSALEKRVQALEDRAEIEQLLIEYGRALDARDFARYSSMFAVNGEWVGSIGSFRGPAAIKAAMEKAFNVPAGTTAPVFIHLLTNAIIDVGGDRATAVSKWTFVRIDDDKPAIANIGRYDDTFIRENGRWKFLRRVAPSALATLTK
jgi:ketosteroid isomerase-like protein